MTPEDQERWRQSKESLEKERSLESLTQISPAHGTISQRDRFGGSLEIRPAHSHAREGSRVGVVSPGEPREEGRVRSQLPAVEVAQQMKQEREEESRVHDHQVESSSDTTLVGSQSQSDTGMGPLPEEGVSGQPKLSLQPVGGKKSRRSPRGKKSKNGGKKNDTASSKKKDAAAKTSSGGGKTSSNTLAVTYTHVGHTTVALSVSVSACVSVC